MNGRRAMLRSRAGIVPSAVMLLVGGVLLCAGPLAGQVPPQAPPIFRAGTDVFRIDVSVNDKDGRPVRGLTAADFSIFENGKPRPVVAFSAVDVPPPVPPTASWLRDVAPDVTTNQVENRRLVVVVMAAGGPIAQRAANAVIDGLGPTDLMAVVLARFNVGAQDFTTDRARLRAAVQGIGLMDLPSDDPAASRDAAMAICACGTCEIQALARIAEYLRDVPDRRKTVFYVSSGVALNFSPPLKGTDRIGCDLQNKAEFDELLRQAQISNTNIYPIDVSGLKPFTMGQAKSGPDLKLEFLQLVASNTGGHAIIKNNRPEQEVPRILAEAGSYYLLGYHVSPREKDTEIYRRLEVKVDRKGVDVHARTRYYEPALKMDLATPPPAPAATALGGLLPDRGLPVRVTLAPFATDTAPGNDATVAVVLGLQRPALDARTTDDLDVIVHAFDPEGRSRGSVDRRATIGLMPGPTAVEYELLSRITLAPGRYEVRVSVDNKTLHKTGSQYAFVDVPDFGREPLSLSGVIVSASSAPAAVQTDLFARFVPVVPTSLREFLATDRVTAFLRVYQGGRAEPVPVSITARITDARDAKVFTTTDTLVVSRFGARRAADYTMDLPLAHLPAGPYLLTLEATTGGRTVVRRDVRFAVK